MANFHHWRLLLKLVTLGVLTLCLSVLSRSGINLPLANTQNAGQHVRQIPTKAATVTALSQSNAPLVVSLARPVSSAPENVDITFKVTNVSNKPIRAYAIKQEVEAGGIRASAMTFHTPELTGVALQPNETRDDFDTYWVLSSTEEHHVTLSVDYVEFSDWTNWGPNSTGVAELSAGQRAAAYMLSKKLLSILNTGGPSAVMNALETGVANIEPLAGHSDQWQTGFRSGRVFVAERLKRAQNTGGLDQVERELRQLAERFKGTG
ncbi:MAG TPA: hypothetical protein VK619_09710 [Pyrinomonadaceae bacterium]|nr:hypothetical protein [Pyrinomonadaceae bacterium]